MLSMAATRIKMTLFPSTLKDINLTNTYIKVNNMTALTFVGIKLVMEMSKH